MGSVPHGISASRGAALMGLSKYKTATEAWLEIMEEKKPGWCEKHGYKTPERVDPWAEPLDPKLAPLRWGLAFEDAICELAGVTCEREKEYLIPEHPFVTCHIDGRSVDELTKTDSRGLLNENKTVFAMAFEAGWGEEGTDQIPAEYQVQIQHQMMCTGDEVARLNALIFPKSPAQFEKEGWKIEKNLDNFTLFKYSEIKSFRTFTESLSLLNYFKQFTIPANAEAQKQILELYLKIWKVNILGETPPPAQGYDDIKWYFNLPEGELEASSEIKELWAEYIDIDNEIGDMQDRQKVIKDIFSEWVIKNRDKVKAANEPRKLNVMAGARKLCTVSKPEPGLKVSRSSVDRIKEDYPALYETMKKKNFADILGEIEFTDAQKEAVEDLSKLLGKKKLTSILSKNSIIYAIEKNEPELFKAMMECALVEETEPVARLTISKPRE